MTAKEMFEELGYRITKKYPLATLCYEFENSFGNKFYILFNSKFKTFTPIAHFLHERNHTYFPALSIQDLQAITQQMKELGWL